MGERSGETAGHGITAHSRTPLVIVAGNLTGMRYRDEIVQPYVIPFIQLRPTTSHFSRTTDVTLHVDNLNVCGL
jgi:hypothetical protein